MNELNEMVNEVNNEAVTEAATTVVEAATTSIEPAVTVVKGLGFKKGIAIGAAGLVIGLAAKPLYDLGKRLFVKKSNKDLGTAQAPSAGPDVVEEVVKGDIEK